MSKFIDITKFDVNKLKTMAPAQGKYKKKAEEGGGEGTYNKVPFFYDYGIYEPHPEGSHVKDTHGNYFEIVRAADGQNYNYKLADGTIPADIVPATMLTDRFNYKSNLGPVCCEYPIMHSDGYGLSIKPKVGEKGPYEEYMIHLYCDLTQQTTDAALAKTVEMRYAMGQGIANFKKDLKIFDFTPDSSNLKHIFKTDVDGAGMPIAGKAPHQYFKIKGTTQLTLLSIERDEEGKILRDPKTARVCYKSRILNRNEFKMLSNRVVTMRPVVLFEHAYKGGSSDISIQKVIMSAIIMKIEDGSFADQSATIDEYLSEDKNIEQVASLEERIKILRAQIEADAAKAPVTPPAGSVPAPTGQPAANPNLLALPPPPAQQQYSQPPQQQNNAFAAAMALSQGQPSQQYSQPPNPYGQQMNMQPYGMPPQTPNYSMPPQTPGYPQGMGSVPPQQYGTPTL